MGIRYAKRVDFEELTGKTIEDIYVSDEDDLLTIETNDGTYQCYHTQDCCENVYLHDIDGDIKRLIGQNISQAYSSNRYGQHGWESFTWTFYHIITPLDSVTIRWYGSSNGYYSESVDTYKLP